ncbi:four helix bundle protein [Myroides odoratimimus]|uniref:four helix bundle protein n=1 Tax=Myroides odoratimimus TaxID=76832 RepID=UPI001CE1A840|nr:four helix bundle protein [Myroides odoratimimus]MCA4793884.1 four helix bundle protein [Myroides odoratimimus]MCA4821144.1 four helix bundle protein [Myroides odoratimimus]
MSYVKAHLKLDAWSKSMDLVVDIYETTISFPNNEQYGLVSQLRRASVSIPSNIAEGAARNSNKEYIQFLYIALGSCSEIDTQILLCQRIKFISDEKANYLLTKIDEVHRLLNGLIKYRKSKI